jgi:hypothetical protein
MPSYKFSPVDGLAKYPYMKMVLEKELMELHWISPYNLGKTTSMLDCIASFACEYPGLDIALTRATQVGLRRSTINKMHSRFGSMLEANEQMGIYRFEPDICPVDGVKKQSKVWALGLDRPDLEDFLSSTEFGLVANEEADMSPPDALDFLIGRNRQIVYSKFNTFEDMSKRKSIIWNVSPDEAFKILREDFNNLLTYKKPLNHPEPLSPSIRMVWNPKGMSPLFERAVGKEYPKKWTEEWVKKNIGLKDIIVVNEELKEDRMVFNAGDIILTDNGKRYFATLQDGDDVFVIDNTKRNGRKRLKFENCNLIKQIGTMYSFQYENKSRNMAASKSNYAMSNKNIRRKTMRSETDTESGIVITKFINRYASSGGHLLERISQQEIESLGYEVIVGLDGGIGHLTVALFGLYVPDLLSVIVFDEYQSTSTTSKENANNMLNFIPKNKKRCTVFYDVAMGHRDPTSLKSSIEDYESVLNLAGVVCLPSARGDAAFDTLNGFLLPKITEIGKPAKPKIYITDNCVGLINAIAKGTWEEVRAKHHGEEIDYLDAFKYIAYGMTTLVSDEVHDAVRDKKLAKHNRYNSGYSES